MTNRYSLMSYDEALSSAMDEERRTRDTAERSHQRNGSQNTAAPLVRDRGLPVSLPNQSSGGFPASDENICRTFQSSSDILRNRRTTVKPSPSPRPASRDVGALRTAAVAPRMPTTAKSGSLDTSDVSTVSDAGTGFSGTVPYVTARHDLPNVAPSSSADLESSNDTSARRHDEAPASIRPKVASIGRSPSESPSRGASKSSARDRHQAARESIGRWVAFLKWRGKWWSPFAVSLRGQINEARAMMLQSTPTISTRSLMTQVEVWLNQLQQFLINPKSIGKVTHLLEHVREVRRSATSAASRERPPPLVEEATSVPEGAAAPELPSDRPESQPVSTPAKFKMLRRGDGKQRFAPPQPSVATDRDSRSNSRVANSSRSQSLSNPNPRDSLEKKGDAPAIATRAQPSTRRTTQNSNDAAEERVIHDVPRIGKEDLSTAKQIQQFLEQIVTGTSDAAAAHTPSFMGIKPVTVSPATMHHRRTQLLETLFGGSHAALSSCVPRFNMSSHGRTLFATPDDAHFRPTGQHALEAISAFYGCPRLLRLTVDGILNDPDQLAEFA